MDSPLPLTSEKDSAAAFGSGDERPALAGRWQPNEGGTLAVTSPEAVEGPSPRLVTRGESFIPPTPTSTETYEIYTDHNGQARVEAIPQPNYDAHPFAALTDWLSFSFPFSETEVQVREVCVLLWTYLSPKLGNLKDRGRGLNGFERSFTFDAGAATFAYGGKAQRGRALVTLPGQACAMIQDWGRAYELLTLLNARITRWDGAVDDFSGQFSVDTAMEWYCSGAFGTGGRKPHMDQHGNWVEPDGTGRTIYIGKRENGKLLCVYEKGKQLGDPSSPWTRWELREGNKSRHIPLEVLIMPGQYVAGGYTCLGWVHEQAHRIRTIQKSGEIGYAYLVHCAKNAYGPLIRVMRKIEGNDSVVLDMLERAGLPRRLRATGIEDWE